MRRVIWVVLLWMALLLTACGGRNRGMEVKDAWARSSPMNADMGAVYFTVINHTGQADALVGVRTEVANAAEIHQSILEGDVMKMQPVPGGRVEVPQGGTVTFKPGGLHVMLMGLKQPLQPGQSFDLVLHFEHFGDVRVQVEVRE